MFSLLLRFGLLLVFACVNIRSICVVAQEASGDLDTAAVRQAMTQFCSDCHSGAEADGGVRLDFLTNVDGRVEENIELVDKVLLVLKEQQMPPTDSEQPEVAVRVKVIEWIEQRLRAFDCGAVSRPGRVTMRRLNKTEYNNTIRDLTGLDLKLADNFPSDDVGNGF